MLDSRTSARDADDVGGVGTRGSGEGICLRRLLHDQYSRRAALDSSHKGQPVHLNAAREVILSAGAIGSPQILMLSGVGDTGELGAVGITAQKHLPGVGKNLQDHLQARPVFKTNLSTINIETNSIFKQGMIALQYAVSQTGPMTMAASLGHRIP